MLDDALFLTCNAFACRSARLWLPGRSTPILSFTHLHQQQPAASSRGSPSKSAKPSPGRSHTTSISTSSSRAGASATIAGARRSSGGVPVVPVAAGRPGAKPASSSSSSSGAYLTDVTSARFVCLDQFVMLTTGNKLLLYK